MSVLSIRSLRDLAILGAALGAMAPAAIAADAPRAAMLLPGSINDQSWNAAGYSGLQKIKSIGFDTAYSENVPDSDDATAMADYAQHGYAIVLAHSGWFLSAAQQVAPDYPKVQFIIGGGAAGLDPNVVSTDYENAQFGCQLGVLAARMSETGKVGGIYGLEGMPNIVAQAGGFRLCAKKTNPSLQVMIIYVKDMEDPAAAKEAALSLIGDGADVLTGKLNAAQNGVIQAAKEKGGKLVSGFVRYGYGTPDQSTGATLAYDKAGKFNPVVPAAVVAEVEGMGQKFASGELKVVPMPDDAKGGK